MLIPFIVSIFPAFHYSVQHQGPYIDFIQDNYPLPKFNTLSKNISGRIILFLPALQVDKCKTNHEKGSQQHGSSSSLQGPNRTSYFRIYKAAVFQISQMAVVNFNILPRTNSFCFNCSVISEISNTQWNQQ